MSKEYLLQLKEFLFLCFYNFGIFDLKMMCELNILIDKYINSNYNK
jgi:hypothetical protein